MKILIFGAGGFIGSNLIEHLIEQGEHEVTGLDVTDAKLAGIEGPNFKFIKGNISDADLANTLTPTRLVALTSGGLRGEIVTQKKRG